MLILALAAAALAEEPAHMTAEWRRAYLEATLPDPGVAFGMSTIYGFGAGHFYAGNPRVGIIHAGVQGGGVALAGVGLSVVAGGACNNKPCVKSQIAMASVGITAFLLDRVIDAVTAPGSAHRTAAKRIESSSHKP